MDAVYQLLRSAEHLSSLLYQLEVAMIPQLPTDNLYKFMTLGGIVIIVFCLWLIRDNSDRLDQALIRYNEATGQYDVAVTNVEQQGDSLEKKLNETSTLIQEALKPENASNVAAAQRAIDAFAALNSEYEKAVAKREDAYKAKIAAKQQGFAFDRVLKRSEQDLLVARINLICGGVILLIGLGSWYLLHQRKQDRLLGLQVEAATNGLTEGKKSEMVENTSAQDDGASI